MLRYIGSYVGSLESKLKEIMTKINESAEESSILIVAHYSITGRLADKLIGKKLGFNVKNGGMSGMELKKKEEVKAEAILYLT